MRKFKDGKNMYTMKKKSKTHEENVIILKKREKKWRQKI